ncbi:MAG TPA: hypothetical protein VN808_09845 [Stellaceae bacterium]|nr:hypothetical protein [Stellaceae bacterium]
MRYLRGAAVALVATGAVLLPLSDASARCWRCGPGPIFWPFAAAAAVVGTAAAIATAPLRAFAPPPAYYPPPAPYYPPAYYAPPPGYYPGYYYGR